ncbi:hypothetical protein HQ865_11310 [Mucilaginibacter mali]|uniref:RHS repeat-associated core domain-containing protein n=1 Tax=Mucilaginibacter mali TaxID=2740462 RepID=A0A7D4PUG0_9SPHI|nr:RHS repeat-associated core domain-containing protein [Mucilaginibacter mali]QKJ30323.1 hypothetical protein HQ865_11310 [Mucilaginibacter mali]
MISGSITAIDDLTYNYDSTNANKLSSMVDGSGSNYSNYGFKNYSSGLSYVYDANGNLTTDPYKGLSLDYNVLNKTDKITLTSTSTGHINYTYDASGKLLRKDTYNTSGGGIAKTTDYVDGMVYENGTLAYFTMPEGRVRNESGTLVNEYIITDQQGNARISFDNTGSGGTLKVVQENSYYPFGMVMSNSPVSTPSKPNLQLYNAGAEWQNDYGDLPDYYQTFYRNYDAALGRFIAVDPKANATESLTPYQYAGNNPAMLNDPMGDLFDAGSEAFYKAVAEGYHETNGTERMDRTYDAVQEMILFAKYGVDAIYGPGGSSHGGAGGGGGRQKSYKDDEWDNAQLRQNAYASGKNVYNKERDGTLTNFKFTNDGYFEYNTVTGYSAYDNGGQIAYAPDIANHRVAISADSETDPQKPGKPNETKKASSESQTKGIWSSIFSHLTSKKTYEYKKDSQGRTYYQDNTGRMHYVMQNVLKTSLKSSVSNLSTYGGAGYDVITKGGPYGTLLGLGYGFMDEVWSQWRDFYLMHPNHHIGTDGKEH